MKKVGILTSGGDCQGLNSAIRGVAKALYREMPGNITIYGIEDGYGGLIYNKYRYMSEKDFSGILTKGGTILGTSRQPFKRMYDEIDGVSKVERMKENYRKMGLDCLVAIGGNGTLKTANLLSGEGINVISMPKTIDNDIWGTEMTFGYRSAVEVATDVIDRIHTTADSHGRIFVIEIMGNKVGWLTLSSGMAGGADVILIPEIPYDIKSVVREIEERIGCGKDFSIIAVAEGAISKDEADMKRKEIRKKREDEGYPSVAYKVAAEIKKECGKEVRVTIPGHVQRGGAPCAYDRILTTQLAAEAARLIKNNKYGCMPVLECGKISHIPLSEAAGKLKSVPPDCEEVKSARAMGVCMGD